MGTLTDKYIQQLNPSLKDFYVWDEEIKGFGVCVRPSGAKTYLYMYRTLEGRQTKIKIARYPLLTTAEARKVAKEYGAQVVLGRDPSKEKKAYRKKSQEEIKSSHTIEDLCAEYLKCYAIPNKRQGSVKEDKRYIRLYILPAFGKKNIKDVGIKELEGQRLAMSEKPYQANRMLACLSKMYSLAIQWGWCEKNPVRGVGRYTEEKRERWLSEEESGRLLEVLRGYKGNVCANAILLLLMTGSRKGEVLGARWEQFDLERGVWTKPSHMTKQKKMEHVPLSSEAVLFLQEMRKECREDSGYVFPGRFPNKPLNKIEDFWRKALKEADIKDVRIHDLRHTYASYLVSSGVSLPVVGKLLGHTQVATTQRYAHLADGALREATNFLSQKLKGIEEKRVAEVKEV